MGKLGRKIFGQVKSAGKKAVRTGAKMGAKYVQQNSDMLANEAINYALPNASDTEKTVGRAVVGKGIRAGSAYIQNNT